MPTNGPRQHLPCFPDHIKVDRKLSATIRARAFNDSFISLISLSTSSMNL
jgi:hypothetical protein